MPTVSFDRHTRAGTIRLRISHEGTRRFLSLDMQVPAKHWSDSTSRVTASHPESQALNRRLTTVEQTARSALSRLQSRPEPITASWMRDEIEEALGESEDGPDGFVAFCWQELEGYKRRGQTGTHKAYQSVLRKFIEYLQDSRGKGEIAFHRVTAPVVRGFRDFCYDVRGNAPNTVGKALHVLRTFVRAAMKEGHMKREHYPYEHITIDSEEVQKEKLTPAEVDQMAQLDLPKTSVIAEVRRWFLFSYYAGGMRFSDVATLRPEHIREGNPRRVQYRMEKVQDHAGVPLVEEAEKILAFYDGPHKGGWVFPILEGETPGDHHQRKESQNAKANDYLKKIARRSGVEKRVTFHLARHGAAWRLYQATGDIYKVSKWLGHASVEQTEAYLKGFEDDSADDDFMAAMG